MRLLNSISLTLILLGLNSCMSNDSFRSHKSFRKYLNTTINDPRSYELPMIQVLDKNIYLVLDSVISSMEKCQNFDDRIKYMHAFMLSTKEESNGKTIYSIFGLHSVEFAIGLYFNRTNGIDKPTDVGVFYHRNYLFVAPIFDAKVNGVSFPFLKKTDCYARIQAPALYKEKVYDSNFDFIWENDQYVILEDHICGNQILITQ